MTGVTFVPKTNRFFPLFSHFSALLLSDLSSPLVAILGPTGSGKSELALALAERFGGEIIGCDSIQVYRRLDIGSAKISLPERRGIPHHLIDISDVDQELTAGTYSSLARTAVSSVQERYHLPIVSGGTGLYLRALLDGLSPAPLRDEVLREKLRRLAARRPGALHRFLLRYDAEAAKRIHAHDQQKLIRAVELTLLARQPASQTQSQPRNSLSGISALKLGLSPARHLLYDRLNQRCESMFAQGLLEETAVLLADGFSPGLKALQSLGYKQAVEHLTGSLSYKDAVLECQTKTRQYAKRQFTWFRREPNVHWLTGFGADRDIEEQAIELTRRFLST